MKQDICLSTLSDKALLELARKGDFEAAINLLRRWCCKGIEPGEACAALRCVPSVSAAKRVLAVMAAERSGACSCC